MTQVLQIAIDRVTAVFLVYTPESAILIDAGPPGATDTILRAVEAVGVKPEALRLILITHGHIDHFGSAAALKARTGAPIAVHALDAPALEQGVNPPESLHPVGWLMTLTGKLFKGGFGYPTQIPPVEPDRTFNAAWRLDEYGIAGQVFPIPGHTRGAVAVVLDTGEALVGDLVRGGLLLKRRPEPPFVAWDEARNRASLRELLALNVSTLYAAHGGPFSASNLRRHKSAK